jgi:simple sugar transport system ATP-binding protein
MQRILVQRELIAGGRVLVAVHPSRGLDVAATERVHSMLIGAVENGAGVLLISEDLDEVLKLSDRIVVLYEGMVLGEFARTEAEREKLGLLMGGATAEAAKTQSQEVSA